MFFEKLLSSDMRESSEGIIHLKMLPASVLGGILEFVYTGYVQISSEDRAQSLIEMVDYLFLPHLKSHAGSGLIQKLNCSNCFTLPFWGGIQLQRTLLRSKTIHLC